MFTLSPVTLTLNTASTLNISGTSTQSFGPDQILAVKLTNESPYALQVTGPGSSQQTWLAPWTEDLYFPGESPTATMQVLPHVVPGGTTLSSAPQSKAVLVAVYVQGDTLPRGQWPMALSRQVNVGNQLNVVSQIAAYVNVATFGTTATASTVLPAIAGYQVCLTSISFSCAALSTSTAGVYQLDVTTTLSGVQVAKSTFYVAASNASSTATTIPFGVPAPLGTGTGEQTTITVSFVPPNSQSYALNVTGYYV